MTKVAQMGTGTDKVSIRPGVSILSVLRHLNYKPWYALAEFVDNSLQSYIDYESELKGLHSDGAELKVEIELESSAPARFVIRDNAAGIHAKDYARAFRPAVIPPDTKGLCEFGMGMKSAACWFAPKWSVRTSALGEEVERTIAFDISKIVKDNLEELSIKAKAVPRNVHYTEIILEELHRPPLGRTVIKIKEHLASIYRMFIADGVLDISFGGEKLSWPKPKVLIAPYYKTPKAEPQRWFKQIEFDFGSGLRVSGFAAIRETASISGAGFALFRRGRLIEGSADEGFRPEKIFGKANSYRYQRIFGELHLEGFEISHTKDGFRWEEHEEAFLELLEEELDSKPLPLLDMAEGYRARLRSNGFSKAAEAATERTAEVIRREVPPVLGQQLKREPDTAPPPAKLPAAVEASKREIPMELNGAKWRVILDLTSDPAISDWLSVGDKAPLDRNGERLVSVRLSLAHPFMERFGGADAESIEPLLRVAAALGLAEIASRDRGVRGAGTIRRILNELLREALFKP